jgi:hypothetical protein
LLKLEATGARYAASESSFTYSNHSAYGIMTSTKYEGLESYEYIDQSYHKLGIDGIFEILTATEQDTMVHTIHTIHTINTLSHLLHIHTIHTIHLTHLIQVKQINFSYNMSLEDVINPREVERFFQGLKRRLLKKNQTLTALDLAVCTLCTLYTLYTLYTL